MPLHLTDDIFESFWAESELQGGVSWIETQQETNVQAILPHLGKFQEYCIDLQEGLGLRIQEWEMPGDLLFTNSNDEDDIDVGFAFYLSGKVQTNLHGLTGEIEEVVGHYDMSNCAGISETEQWQAGEPFLRVYIEIDPGLLFGNLTGDSWVQLPVELRRSLEGNHRPYAITSSHPRCIESFRKFCIALMRGY